MIIDRLDNYRQYQGLGERIFAGLIYLNTTDFSQFEPGEHPIEGKDLFAIINDYNLKSVTEGRLEAHQRYLDIQYLAQGGESIGYVPLTGQSMCSEYNEGGDYSFYIGTSSLIRIEQGMFAIFYPDDLHMPGIGAPGERVRKVVVKVRI